MDCWDGPDGKPMIYHGRTLTTRIMLDDVLVAIRDHAFVASEYPVILSIENHCSIKQQRYMARTLINTFGDLLLTKPIDETEACLPSPEQLRRRIIIKHKKFYNTANQADESSTTTTTTTTTSSKEPAAIKHSIKTSNSFRFRRADSNKENGGDSLEISDSIKTGDLLLWDPQENRWIANLVMLSAKRLSYIQQKMEDEELEDDEDEESNIYGHININNNNNSNTYDHKYSKLHNYFSNSELHFSEAWFHGKRKNGRRLAGKILHENEHMGDGTFLVRESITHPGDYSLSFLYNQKVHHSRIQIRTNAAGERLYQLNELNQFRTLFDLIDYYRTHPLKSEVFQELYLRDSPLQEPRESNLSRPWFYKELTREGAENILRRLRHEGAFLVRPSDKEEGQFCVSFRARNVIKHCRICKEGRLFTIRAGEEFETLTEMVEYYEKVPLYKSIRLSFPASQESLRILGQEFDDESKGSYMAPETLLNEPNLLSGGPDENEEDEDEDDTGMETFGTMTLKSDTTVQLCTDKGLHAFRVGSLLFQASSKAELLEWVNKIQEAVSARSSGEEKQSKEAKRSMKIASELNDLVIYCCAVHYTGSKC